MEDKFEPTMPETPKEKLSDKAKQRAFKASDEKKGAIADELDGFASRMEGQEGSLGRLTDEAARLFHRLSGTLRERSTEDLLASAKREFQARPGVFIAGCLALGFLGARLLKS